MRPRAELEAVREIDPDFSLVLFEDFVYALVGRAHAARGGGRLAELGAYLSEAAQRALGGLSGELAAVDGVIVGAMRYVRVAGGRIDARPARRRARDRDQLHRDRRRAVGGARLLLGARALAVEPGAVGTLAPPERQRSFGCPDCGAPLGTRDAARCAHCGRPIDPADFDWLVETVALVERRSTPPALTGTVHESGTHLDTIVDPDAEARRDAIAARDANFTWPAFLARVRHVFAELQPAWSELDLLRARPCLSDNLFQTWMFWIDAYRRAGLRNVNERAKVTGVRLARVVSDRAVDAITVRLRATGLDYTIDAAGQVVSGNRDEPRDYSNAGRSCAATRSPGRPAPTRAARAAAARSPSTWPATATTAARACRRASSTGCSRAWSRTSRTRVRTGRRRFEYRPADSHDLRVPLAARRGGTRGVRQRLVRGAADTARGHLRRRDAAHARRPPPRGLGAPTPSTRRTRRSTRPARGHSHRDTSPTS